jgi:hypothetical protein
VGMSNKERPKLNNHLAWFHLVRKK